MKTDRFVSELIDTLSDPTSRIRVISLLAKYAGQVVYIPVSKESDRRVRAAAPTGCLSLRGARRTSVIRMSRNRVTKAVIPAAGLGTRFLPATKATPKEMLPVVDRPAIQYVVEEAVDAGLDDVLISSLIIDSLVCVVLFDESSCSALS